MNSIFNKKVLALNEEVLISDSLEKLRSKTALAYFSMEYGLKDELPIFSGGLGVLSGDTLRSAADLGVPGIALGILWKDGYFTQKLENGEQISVPHHWDPLALPEMTLTDQEIVVDIQDIHRNMLPVKLKVWRYEVKSADGSHSIPLFLLDANHPDNLPWMQDFTAKLYDAQNTYYKIMQRYILGVGGMKLARVLSEEYEIDFKYHLNEGHAAMALVDYAEANDGRPDLIDNISDKFFFTIHTPVDAGLDRISINDLYHILPGTFVSRMISMGFNDKEQGLINLPYLAMKYSSKINGVAELHGIVTKQMFPDFIDKIIHITNGVYSGEKGWQLDPIRNVLKEEFALKTINWQRHPELFKESLYYLKAHEEFRLNIEKAHQVSKKNLIEQLNGSLETMVFPLSNIDFEADWLTIGYARRFAAYKRADLLFYDLEKLVGLAKDTTEQNDNGIQFVFAGKSHPNDDKGKGLIKNVNDFIKEINQQYGEYLRLKFVVNYNMRIGALMTAGVDFWLNNPMSPMEASGTSGMKAALNGVPQISTYDGWWPESEHNCGITFGTYTNNRNEGSLTESYHEDARLLYKALTRARDIFYDDHLEMRTMRINAILGNGSFFNTHRMVREYMQKMWDLEPV